MPAPEDLPCAVPARRARLPAPERASWLRRTAFSGLRLAFGARLSRETDFYLLSWGSSYFDSLEHFSYLIRSDAPYNATGYANPHVDDLIGSIGT